MPVILYHCMTIIDLHYTMRETLCVVVGVGLGWVGVGWEEGEIDAPGTEFQAPEAKASSPST
jgi:hypothetical protein